MPRTFEFCLPTSAASVPDRPVWLHEVKYDGYRLRLEREGNRVRLITRRGYNWSDRYPWIVEVARKNRHKQFIIDGEAVLLTFDALHSRRHDELSSALRLRHPGVGWRGPARPNLVRAEKPPDTPVGAAFGRHFCAPFEQGELGRRHGVEAG